MKFMRRLLASSICTLVFAGAAAAGGISTPILFLGGGNQLICIANNVSSQTLTVRVLIVGLNSSSLQQCTLSPPDRDGCQGFLNNQSGHCRITIAGLTDAQVRERVRGVFFARTTAPPFTIGPVVQAE